MQKPKGVRSLDAVLERYRLIFFNASRKSADNSRMRCNRAFSWRNSSVEIPKNVCLCILSICSCISRASSSRSFSTLGPFINHFVEDRKLAGKFIASRLWRTAEWPRIAFGARP